METKENVFKGYFEAKSPHNKKYFVDGKLILTEITGDANFEDVWGFTEFEAPYLKKIGGVANFRNWKGSAPQLVTIEMDAIFDDSWIGNVPKLTTIKGYANFQFWGDTDALSLIHIGGNAHFGNWRGKAPKLLSIGGDKN
jgi:hypothetical protein